MSNPNKLLSRANVLVRKGRPHRAPDWRYNTRRFPVRFYPDAHRKIIMTFVHLRSYGCRFDRRGECTMCNYGIAERVEPDLQVAAVEEALAKNAHYEALYISPAGSMFDPFEVPPVARRRIFELVAATDCTSFSCESRPEFITDAVVAEFQEVLREKRRFVNVGLESADPWILQNCVGKFMELSEFTTAAARLLATGSLVTANILLGAPFLTEREAINDAVRSVRWALENGAYMCVLFPSNVKDWTLQHWLWERGLYNPPSLWSYIEALYVLGPDILERVGLSKFAVPKSEHYPCVPQTCPACYEGVVSKLNGFVDHGDFMLLEEARQETPCGCRSSWEVATASATTTLQTRIIDGYDQIGTELVGSWWEKNRHQVLDSLLLSDGPGALVA